MVCPAFFASKKRDKQTLNQIPSPDYSSGCMNWLAVVAQAVERVQEKGA
jgi:hypothetical protein